MRVRVPATYHVGVIGLGTHVARPGCWRRYVINLYGQCRPGVPKSAVSSAEREQYFQQGLDAIAALQPRPTSIAFPHLIGCGLAGGKWTRCAGEIV